MQIGHIRTAASCAHLIRLNWQIVYIVQLITLPRMTRITGGTALPLYANALCPTAESYVATSVNGPRTSGGSATTCCWAKSGVTIQNELTIKQRLSYTSQV